MARTRSERQAIGDASVYLVADHLDAMLAAGEDILALKMRLAVTGREQHAAIVLAAGEQRRFVERLRVLELTLLNRALQARTQASALVKADGRFATSVLLFFGGTAALVDAVDDLTQAPAGSFHAGDDPMSYLRSRNIVSSEAASFGAHGSLSPTEDVLIAGRITLRDLLDLAATFLDALELHYELFEAADRRSAA
jgi:hypothetical protein